MARGRWKRNDDRNDKYGRDRDKGRNDDDDNGYGSGYGNDSGERGDWHGGGSSLTKLMLNCQKAVSNVLQWGKFSDKSVTKALDIIEGYKALIDLKISKWVKPDTEPVSVTVKATAAATGDNAEANAHVKIGIFDGDGYKLCIGSAESYAATDGGETYVNTFAGVKGVDTGSISSFHGKGKNFEKAVETLVAIDWEDVYDKNIVFSKHHSFYSRMKKDVGEGKSIHATNDAYVEADSQASVDQAIKALAIDDLIAVTVKADVSAL